MSDVSAEYKLDFSWKLLRDLGITTPDKRWYEEYIGAHVETGGRDIWAEDVHIPDPPPVLDTPWVQVHGDVKLTMEPTVGGSRAWIAASVYGDPTTRLTRWIPPRYGQGYQIRLYQDDGFGGRGAEVPTTHPVGWVPLYFGVLACENPPADSGLILPLHWSGYRYVGPVGVAGAGDKTYVHEQVVPSVTWTVPHGLSKYPAVTILDEDIPGVMIVPDEIIYTDGMSVEVRFKVAQAGRAICN